MKNKKIALFVTVLAILIVGGGALLGFLLAGRDSEVPAGDAASSVEADLAPQEDNDLGKTVTVDGKTYELRQNLSTILFLGVDQTATVASGEITGESGRSDTILLFLLDKENQTTQMVEISRDTMMDVDVYSLDGTYVYSGNMQLNMQYAFGKTPRISCRLTSEKVSELLYGIDVDATVSLTMSGIPDVIEALGGVDLTLTQDYTDIDPAFLAGERIHLDGNQVYDFVHYRDLEETGSNDARMERQNQLIRALFETINASENALTSAAAMWDAAQPYLQSDLDATDIRDLAQYTLLADAIKLPGETVAGALHDEYHVDEQALRSLVLELFYTEADQ